MRRKRQRLYRAWMSKNGRRQGRLFEAEHKHAAMATARAHFPEWHMIGLERIK